MNFYRDNFTIKTLILTKNFEFITYCIINKSVKRHKVLQNYCLKKN
jgi:hypothetical protein